MIKLPTKLRIVVHPRDKNHVDSLFYMVRWEIWNDEVGSIVDYGDKRDLFASWRAKRTARNTAHKYMQPQKVRPQKNKFEEVVHADKGSSWWKILK